MTDLLSVILAPISPDLFFKRYWRKEHLQLKGSSPARHDSIVSMKEIDLLLQSGHLPAALINVTKDGVSQPLETWSRFEKSARGEVQLAVPERLLELYRIGATVILNGAHCAIPSLSMACRQLAVRTGLSVGANIYLTPPNAQGFARHSDKHEVLVLLLSGAKTFLLYPEGEDAPREVQLEAGDLLYLPQGLAHEARTEATFSVHATIGITPAYAFQLIEELAARAKNDPRFQHLIPAIGAEPGLSETFENQFRIDLLDLIEETPMVSLATQRFRTLVNGKANAWAGGRFADLQMAPSMTIDTICTLRAGVFPVMEVAGKDVRIESSYASVTAPRFLRKACEELLDGSLHSVREISGLVSDRGKIYLSRMLVEGGLLTIVKI